MTAIGKSHGFQPGLPIRPVFVCAILFAGVIRITEFYLRKTTVFDGYYWFWQIAGKGFVSVGSAVKYVCAAFLLLSFIELVTNPRQTGCRASFLFCLLLAVYGFGLDYSTASWLSRIRGGG